MCHQNQARQLRRGVRIWPKIWILARPSFRDHEVHHKMKKEMSFLASCKLPNYLLTIVPLLRGDSHGCNSSYFWYLCIGKEGSNRIGLNVSNIKQLIVSFSGVIESLYKWICGKIIKNRWNKLYCGCHAPLHISSHPKILAAICSAVILKQSSPIRN